MAVQKNKTKLKLNIKIMCLVAFVLPLTALGQQIPFGFFKAQIGNVLQLLAGSPSGIGNLDGTGAAASFSYPDSVALDSAGNLYVADSENNTIRKITPAGVVTTLAGTAGNIGSADGTGTAASFDTPIGLAVDSAGNVYVADSGSSTIRKITSAGVVTTLAGMVYTYGSDDGTGAAASFNSPSALAVDSTGNVYVADTYNSTIRKITPAGVVTTFAGTAGTFGSVDGSGAAASFNFPFGLAVDSVDNIYVADTANSIIRKITPAGDVTTLAGTAGNSGSSDGTGVAASFSDAYGLTVDPAGTVYVVDSLNNTIRKITSSGVVTTLAGTAGASGSADGTGAAARFYTPNGLVVDSTGNVYVADTKNRTIRKITPGGVVSTFAGTALGFGSADATGAAASFDAPDGLAVDSAGNVYVADSRNFIIRKITPAGIVTTIAGSVGNYGSADGTGAAASFSQPHGVGVDSANNVYVADTYNSTIRKITPAGVVSTFAGTARTSGSADGTGAAARFNYPFGLAVDSVDNIYVADTYSSTIRKITPAGVVTTLAGTPGNIGYADGNGAAAIFNYPGSVALDSAGNLYVADSENNAIRKITPAGVVTTFAGMAGTSGSADGTGAAASFNYLDGLAVDSAGNVYVADSYNNKIRKITPASVVSTVLGSSTQFGIRFGSLPGVLSNPSGVAVRSSYLYLSEGNTIAKCKAP